MSPARGDLREQDIRALKELLEDPERLTRKGEYDAFASMLDSLTGNGAFPDLTPTQRAWVLSRCDDLGIVAIDPSSRNRDVPRGREVETPELLRRENLPMRPPAKKA